QLSSDLAVRVVTAALQKDPSNALGIELLERLQTLGVQASPESVQASLEYWQQATEQKPDDETSRMLLTRLLVATGSIDKAAESIQPLVAERPELRRLYANLLRQSGESEESAELLEE